MKKGYWLPLLVLSGILLFSLWTGRTMERHTTRWREQLRQVDALAQAENWPEATAFLVEGYRDWSSHQTWLHILAKHDTVDGAETMYCRAIAFALAREPSEFRAELADLEAQLGLLAETEHLNVQNVL